MDRARRTLKTGKEHRVSLFDSALPFLNTWPLANRDALVFASPRGGKLPKLSLTAVLRQMKVDALSRGTRSSFREWCAERTNHPLEVAEMHLAHAIGDKVKTAHWRELE